MSYTGRKKYNKKAEKRRYQRYHDTVWKGWSRTEKPSKVTTYSIEELEKQKKD